MKSTYNKPSVCVFVLKDKIPLLAGSLQITSGDTTFTNGGTNDGSDGAKSVTFDDGEDEEWMSFYDYYNEMKKSYTIK
jgi:hypothetical protein